MGQERIIHAALLGAGTVGSGVYKLVKDLEEEIISKTGARLVVDKILVRDTTKAREGIPSELLIDRWDEILNDPQIEIVIEVMGGIRPALTWLEEALRAGKQVVTANKDLLAEYGEQLFDAAEAGKCDLHFEAAVAGAIPIIRPLRQSLVASELTEVMGIVNGTTNYIPALTGAGFTSAFSASSSARQAAHCAKCPSTNFFVSSRSMSSS